MADDAIHTGEAEPTTELATNISETVSALFSAGSVQETLVQVVHLAVTTIEGCDFAGIFLVRDNQVTTPVSTAPVVIEVDALQHSTGEGPCLDAMSQGISFYADDLGEDDRWPLFGPQALARGMRSLLAVPLLINGAPGALNLYARYPQAFGVIDRGRGLLLAAMAGLAFSSAQTHEDEERRAANLHAALSTREVIGQAQGILMERERITSNQAFDILRRASQHLNRKLRDVAQNLVDTGERPDTG
jgi:GAF domain-containing protein